jgi:hypothetical protein
MRTTIAAALVMLGATGCGGGVGPHPTVVISNAFSPEQVALIEEGVSSWTALVPDLRPTFVVRDAGQAWDEALADRPESDTVHVLPIHGPEASCPHAGVINPGGDPTYQSYIAILGVTDAPAHESWAVTCIDVGVYGLDHIGANHLPPNEMSATAAHEFGHAMGLPHVATQGDLMYVDISGESFAPTCDDAVHMAKRTGLSTACR